MLGMSIRIGFRGTGYQKRKRERAPQNVFIKFSFSPWLISKQNMNRAHSGALEDSCWNMNKYFRSCTARDIKNWTHRETR